MSSLTQVSARLARSDLLQLATLLFAVLFFSFVITWPASPSASNDTWFAVAQARILGLSLLALGYGSALSGQKRTEQRALALALLCLALLSAPLEVMSYALSYPPQPLFYSLGLTLLDTYALFGVGLLLGRLLGFLRLRALLPLAVPALLVGLVMADLAIDLAVLNPLAALTTLSPWHLASMAVIGLVSSVYLFLPKESVA